MFSGSVLVDRRFGFLRAIAYLLRSIAIVGLVLSITATLTFTFAILAIFNALPILAALSLPSLLLIFGAALSTAAVGEMILVLLAIEENTRGTSLAATMMAQAGQKQPDVLAELQKITQNTRFTADDVLKIANQQQPMSADVRRILSRLAAWSGKPIL